MTQRARLVVDWGTSNFRCYRFAPDGTVAQTHQAAAGILSVTDRDFAAVLQREIGSWISPDMDVFLSGMITSRNNGASVSSLVKGQIVIDAVVACLAHVSIPSPKGARQPCAAAAVEPCAAWVRKAATCVAMAFSLNGSSIKSNCGSSSVALAL
jgi:hypothetical protein